MKPTIKVLNVIIEDRIGGPQRRIPQAALALSPKGVETVVILPAKNGGFQDILRKKHIPFHEIPSLRRPRATLNPMEHLRYLISFIPAVMKIRRVIISEKIDIVHQNDMTQVQGAIAAKLTGRKIVWHLNSYYPPLVARFFNPIVLMLADHIIAVSRSVGDAYCPPGSTLYDGEVQIVYSPADISRFHGNISPVRIKKEFDLEDAYPVIGLVGNLNPVKGHRYFIDAAKEIKAKHPESKFLIVGGILENRMDYYAFLKDRVARHGLENDIVFTDTRDDIPEILSAMDIFVLPSLSEGTPLALIEAMACERPCIATDVGGIGEVIENGKSGFLIPPMSPRKIIEAVDILMSDPDKAKKMGKTARQRVEAFYTLQRCADGYYEAYAKLLGLDNP